MPTFDNNLILGRGRLYFGRFPANQTVINPLMRYFGNTPAVNANVTEETLEHFDSDSGLKVKDRVVTLSQEMAGSFQCDNISLENLALFFAAGPDNAAQTSVANAVETITGFDGGEFVGLGVTALRPQGYRNITVDSVVNPTGPTTLATPADYEVDSANGRIWLSNSTAVGAATSLVVTYDVPDATVNMIADLNESIYGRMEYVSDNPVGSNFKYIWPYVKLTADGDLALKGDDWQVMNFNFEVLRFSDAVPRQIIIPVAPVVGP